MGNLRPLIPILIAATGLFPRSLAAAPPEAPVLKSPANGITIQSLIPAFYWHKTMGASTYTFQIAEDSLFSLPVDTYPGQKDTANTYRLANSIRNFWRVSATNADGTGPWSESWRLTLLAPGATAIQTPRNGARYQPESPELVWNRLDAAATYSVEVAEDSGFTRIKYAYANLTDHFMTTDPLDFGTYYWRARAVNAAGAGPWSPAGIFIVSLPEPPVLEWPPNDTSGIAPSTQLSWGTSVGADRDRYYVEVSEDSSFSSLAFSSGASAGQYSFVGVIANLLPGKRYYWRAYATNSSFGAAWSRPWSFTTRSSPSQPPHLVARWDFEEGQGGQVLDKSGNGHNGVLVGEPVRGGAGGKALHFNGRSAVSVPFDSQFRLDRFTVMAWVNLDSGTYQQCLICRPLPDWGSTQLGWNYDLLLIGKANYYGAPQNAPGVAYGSYPDAQGVNSVPVGETSVFAESSLSRGSWHQIAATFENRRLRLYVDGKPSGAKDSLPAEPDWWDDTEGVTLGNSEPSTTTGYGFFGWMDEARIYSFALSATQIDSAYRAFTPPGVPTVPLDPPGRSLSRIRLRAAGDLSLRITGLAAPAHVEIRGLDGRKRAEWGSVRNGQSLNLAETHAMGLLLIRITEPGETVSFKLPVLSL